MVISEVPTYSGYTMYCKLLAILYLATAANSNIISIPLHKLGDNVYTEELQSSGDPIFYGIVTVGTPPQSFRIAFDTSSADFWVPNTKCHTSTAPCETTNKFDQTKSSTWRKNGSVYEINYETGTALGYYAYDTVKFAGLTLTDQSFGETTNENGYYMQKWGFDGILGLGYPALAWRGTPPLFSAYQKGLIQKPIFSFHFSKNAAGFTGAKLIIGGSDSKYYKGSFEYAPVTQQKYWLFNLDNFQVNSQTFGSNLPAIIDTISPYITGPPAVIDPINQIIGATKSSSDRYEFNCGKLSSLPNITLKINGKSYTLKPEDYTSKNGNLCVSYFRSLDINHNRPYRVIVGYTFLARYYTEFDFGNNRIGFAQSA